MSNMCVRKQQHRDEQVEKVVLLLSKRIESMKRDG